jgi:hypothetical protein
MMIYKLQHFSNYIEYTKITLNGLIMCFSVTYYCSCNLLVTKSLLVKILLVVGFILIIAGIIFVAQSNSMIGPQSSFMYSNPQWTVNGFAISAMGLIILVCALVIHFVKTNR